MEEVYRLKYVEKVASYALASLAFLTLLWFMFSASPDLVVAVNTVSEEGNHG